MRIHHILANGKEVESVAGKVINVSEFPMLSSVFRSVNQRIHKQMAVIFLIVIKINTITAFNCTKTLQFGNY